MINTGDFVVHNETLSIYKVFIGLGETFVDYSGCIHVASEYRTLNRKDEV